MRAAAVAALAAVTACAGTGTAPRGPAPAADTVALALLETELVPPIDTRGFDTVSRHALPAGAVALVTELAPAPATDAPVLRMMFIRPGTDARDLLDGDAAPDLLITRDPVAIAYARARPGRRVDPLPWDRVHVAVVTDPSRTRIAPTPALRESLAHDAVRADARAARDRYAWQAADCATPPAPAGGQSPERRVAYRADDAVGRDLAERLVAMDGTVTAAALAGETFDRRLAAGADAVFIVSLPAAVAGAEACAALAGRGGAAVVPLVETRPHAVARDGTPPLVLAPGAPVRYASPAPPASR